MVTVPKAFMATGPARFRYFAIPSPTALDQHPSVRWMEPHATPFTVQ